MARPTTRRGPTTSASTPRSTLQDKAEKHTYRVRELEGDERQDWWDHAVATWSTYGDYQKKTDR